jgi:hypothetical protein
MKSRLVPRLAIALIFMHAISLVSATGIPAKSARREEQWVLVSEEANPGSLDDRMKRMRGFGHEREPWRLLDALEHGLFVKELAHKEIQVHREPVT